MTDFESIFKKLRVAIVHDWLVEFGGAERVLKSLLDVFPQADVFTMVHDENGPCQHLLQGRRVETSIIQNFPGGVKKYRRYLPFMPFAVEQFDLSAYDLVISSSYAVAKGVITSPDQCHISYVHSPIRYAWDLQNQYLEQSNLLKGLRGTLAKIILHYIRIWDVRSSFGVDQFACNSKFIARRIKKFYQRDATVIYPPVDVESFTVNANSKLNYYVTTSRLVQYKRVDILVKAFNQMPDKKLKIIGKGPEFEKLSALANSNIEMIGWVTDEELKIYLQNARAFVYAAEEDFGISLVEAQACGTPVITFGKGGAKETVIPNETGILYEQQKEESLISAIIKFEATEDSYDPFRIRENAEKFSEINFLETFKSLVKAAWQELD